MLGTADPALGAAMEVAQAAGLPPIEVSPAQGRFLALMVHATRARRVLEIGTLGGYSAIWLARGLPAGGTVVTLEKDPAYAAVARAAIAAAGVADQVRILVGDAAATLADLSDDSGFDLIFVDADKASSVAYARAALRLARAGATILFDNVVREGMVLDADSSDPSVRGTRDLYAYVAAEPRLSASTLQTVGAKGWDGFMMAVVDAGI